jgi:hypothetical protein
MVANVTAKVPKTILMILSPAEPAATIDPTNVIPEMAFDPDIKGVCSVAGTFDITSNPRKMDNIKINAKKISVFVSIFILILKYFSEFD